MLKPGIPRDQLFYTSKVPPKSINYDGAKKCVDESLIQTGMKYIDLYLLHAPYGGKEGRLGAWKALVEAVQAGKVRSIGVSNFGVHHLEELEQWIKQQEKEGKDGGKLSVNQVELHPWLAREDIVSWCKQRGVVMEVSAGAHVYRAVQLLNFPGILPARESHEDRRPSAGSTRKEVWQNFHANPASLGTTKGRYLWLFALQCCADILAGFCDLAKIGDT